MKFFLSIAAATLLLPLVSCGEDLSDGTVIFYNFSPVTVMELNVYDSMKTGSSYSKKDLVYTCADDIKTARDHIFALPEKHKAYFFEIKTEEGETYEGGPFGSFGITSIIFSVDYDVLEYEL
ncbi:MAG: hypothetical protein LBP80_04220 [Treponema sp.]|jgi:hypothetical protein|nr:hypothetical protein [Treponema sp.]